MSSKSECKNRQVHYQLKFDIPQAGYSCINYDMTEVGKTLQLLRTWLMFQVKRGAEASVKEM